MPKNKSDSTNYKKSPLALFITLFITLGLVMFLLGMFVGDSIKTNKTCPINSESGFLYHSISNTTRYESDYLSHNSSTFSFYKSKINDYYSISATEFDFTESIGVEFTLKDKKILQVSLTNFSCCRINKDCEGCSTYLKYNLTPVNWSWTD